MFFPRIKTVRNNATFGDSLALFDRVLGGVFNDASTRIRSGSPAFNIWADENEVIMTSEMPGVAIEDLNISISGKQLAIEGVRNEAVEEGQRHARGERVQGRFQRTFELPFAVDSSRVEAKLTDGVLRIALPKAESEKPRKIEIRAE